MNGSEIMYTDVNWHGLVGVPGLQRWLGLDWLSLLEGETEYQSRLRITPDLVDLTVSSTLQGMEIELPAPWLNSPNQQCHLI